MPSITASKTYSAPGPASAVWECTLDLPHSFAAGDGLSVQTSGQGASKDEASEVACLRAVAHLISARPSRFLLRPKHWAVTPQELLAHLPGADAGHQALPVHIPARLRDAGEEATTPDADARMVALVRRCLDAHGGEFDPSRISSKLMGLDPGEERVYSTFNKLLVPQGMKAFIESHPEFSWRPKDNKGMLITWAHGQVALEVPPVAAGVAAPGSASASCEHVASGHSEAPAATAAGDGHSEAPPAPGSASAFGAVGGEDPGAIPHFSHVINRGRTAIAHPVAELWAQALPGQDVRWRGPPSLSTCAGCAPAGKSGGAASRSYSPSPSSPPPWS